MPDGQPFVFLLIVSPHRSRIGPRAGCPAHAELLAGKDDGAFLVRAKEDAETVVEAVLCVVYKGKFTAHTMTEVGGVWKVGG